MQTSKGFTLIELLVVIAIIGILAGMVVVNMTSAPNAARDATVKSYMDQIKSVAAIELNNNGGYTSLGPSITDYTTATTQIGAVTTWKMTTTSSRYCMWAKLLATPGSSWCIDSTGVSKKVTATSTCENATTPVCP